MIDQAVQQNSANVEETSAAAHELSSQASKVYRILSRFAIN